jgi:uncharacterized membrane protein YtjA (UPF0391 family)
MLGRVEVVRGYLRRTTSPLAATRLNKELVMLYYAAVFFVIAIIAGIFGFGGIAVGAAEIARILFFIFLVIFLVSLIMGIGKGRWRS